MVNKLQLDQTALPVNVRQSSPDQLMAQWNENICVTYANSRFRDAIIMSCICVIAIYFATPRNERKKPLSSNVQNNG